MMKQMTFGLVALLLLAGWSGAARAELINGGFENGDLTGWVLQTRAQGQGSVQSSIPKIIGPGSFGPVEGSHYAYLSAGGGNHNGTHLSQFFTAGVGDVLRFSVFFDDADTFYADSAFASLALFSDGTTSGPVAVIGLISLYRGGIIARSRYPESASSLWTEVTYPFTTPGTYRLSFSVSNGYNNLPSSALGVDNVRVEPAPAPSAAVLAGIGACLLWGSRSLRRRRTG